MSGPDWDSVARRIDIVRMRNSLRHWMITLAVAGTAIIILAAVFLLAACGTTGIKPEEKLVSSVTSLPPVVIPIPAPCINKIPSIPNIVIDPNATPLQRNYQKKEAILAYEQYVIDANAELLRCAAKEPKP